MAATALVALTSVLYSFGSSFSLDEHIQMLLEVVTLMSTVVVGAVAGAALEVCRISKARSERLFSMLGSLSTSSIVLIVGAYTMVHYFGAQEFGFEEAILKAAILMILIVIGTMLGVKFGIQRGVFSIGDAANAPRDIYHASKNNDTKVSKWISNAALAILLMVPVAAVLSPPDPPMCLVPPYPPTCVGPHDALFTASATIMGFAAFGSALSTLSPNKDLTKGIAFTLIPVIVVQMVFMLSLLGHIDFSAMLWIIMTGLLLMLLVLAMVANSIKSTGMHGCTDAPRFF